MIRESLSSARGIPRAFLLALGIIAGCALPQQTQEGAIEPRFAERAVMPFFQAAERSDPAALYVRDGTIAHNPPGPYSSIKQGVFQP